MNTELFPLPLFAALAAQLPGEPRAYRPEDEHRDDAWLDADPEDIPDDELAELHDVTPAERERERLNQWLAGEAAATGSMTIAVDRMHALIAADAAPWLTAPIAPPRHMFN